MNKIKDVLIAFKGYFLKHKLITAILVVFLIGISIFNYNKTKNSSETIYTIGTVETGTIISSVSGTGQISASSQVDLKPKASGEIAYIGVVQGQKVKAGTLIARLDTRDILISLENAKIALAKLKDVDHLTLIQAQNSLEQAKQSLQNNKNNLSKAYDDGFSDISDAFLKLPDIMIGLDELLHNDYQSGGFLSENRMGGFSTTVQNYRKQADATYYQAKTKYDTALAEYKSLSRTSASSSIEKAILDTYDAVQLISDTVKNVQNTIDYIRTTGTNEDRSATQSILTDLNSWTSSINSIASSLLSIKSTIQTSKDGIKNAEMSIQEKTESLAKIQNGPDELDLKSQELALQQKQNEYENYFVYAPFDGTVAKLSLNKGDTVSSGTAIGVLISDKIIADVSLNEVDITKIEVGQKAIVTFDAIEDLSISAKVVQVDMIGTASQGVVSYNVKVALDTNDERVRSGMSANVSIITEVKQDVIAIANDAVKSQGDQYYVQTFDSEIIGDKETITTNQEPEKISVEIGSADDEMTEITSGLSAGDKIIIKSVKSGSSSKTNSSTQTKTPSLFGGMGGAGGPPK